MDIFQWSFTTFRKKKKKKKRLFLRRSNFQPWRSIGDIWLKRCKFSAKRDTINPRLKIGEHSDGDNNLGQWEEGEREGGRGGKTIRSTIRLNFCLHWHMDGISIVERPLAWPGKKKSERERESAGRLKAREDLSSNGSKDRYSRSATNHFDEVTKISPFPSSLPVSLSLPFSTP